ncbi:hypothetical protein RvY_04788 [Ramazzottius varieornatus]|uniref:Transmembrane protein 267 n=1 Tax=Ramazzottius varieornatus TaxID=947166 RepID=A0A1D1UWA9_RAMVA|nr:hypothetical protein RvY_04788 [Ramazzottius varieornatus]
MAGRRTLLPFPVFGLLLMLPPLTILGDYLLFRLSDNDAPLTVKALFDSSVHALLGLISWTAVLYGLGLGRTVGLGLLFAVFSSVAVDMDHFIKAKSFHLEDALHMVSPPPFHDSLLPFLMFAVAMVDISYSANNKKHQSISQRSLYLLQLFTTVSVHLFRDAARRGLSIGYVLLMPPRSPFGLFPFFIPLFPLFTRYLLSKIGIFEQQLVKNDREPLQSIRTLPPPEMDEEERLQ